MRGYELQRSVINHLLNWLRSMSPKARSRVPGLSPERSEIIIAGVAIVDAVMQRLKVNTLRVHDRGIRDGLILSMLREIYPQAGIAAVNAIQNRSSLESYHLLHAVLGEFESRLGHAPAAAAHFQKALQLAEIKSEQAFLAKRLQACEKIFSRQQ